MLNFINDYSEGAAEEILKALAKINLEQQTGYGEDAICEEAKSYIRRDLKSDDCLIRFLVGGTQTNMVSLTHFLRPYQAVIAADTAHIATHETGAIEGAGHKVFVVPNKDGKIDVDLVRQAFDQHTDYHMVQPKLVYISNPTEIGTIYTKSEIEELSKFCKEKNLYFYVDGARLPAALMAKENDLPIDEYKNYFDAMYIGGTKCGALFGEALVIFNKELQENIDYTIKQRGSLLAKGWLLGIQFRELFRDGLYYRLAKNGNDLADKIQQTFCEKGFNVPAISPTNQIFVVLDEKTRDKLSNDVDFRIWEKYSDGTAMVRFVTSWATDAKNVEKFVEIIKAL